MNRGFSLVELSIVLVILGLLTGGILAGQSLIRASELRSVSVDYQRFSAAINSFRDKYFAIPGDMTNATKFWNAADGGDGIGADCGNIESTSATTCNGNGDGGINNAAASSNSVYEKLRIWQQLANAGLIEGSYTGAPNASVLTVAGIAVPRSRIGNGGYEATGIGVAGSAANFYKITQGMVLKLGIMSAATGMNNAILTASEAWNMDTKMDDGLSDSGKFLALDGADVGGCVTNGIASTLATTGSYTLNGSAKSCTAWYFPGF